MEQRTETPLTVMIPLGGIGSRFQKEGYTQPKPFVSVLGKPMILWVLDSLSLLPVDDLVIVYDPNFIPPKFWGSICDKYPKLRLVRLSGPTRGAAETVMIGLRGLPPQVRSQPVMLIDGDAFYDQDIVSMYRSVAHEAHGVFYFLDTQPKPLYSYVVFDSDNALISQVKEKVKISDFANTGCYCFMSGKELEHQCQALIDANLTQLSQDAVGEYYTSGVIAQMIEEGHRFKALQVDPSQLHVLGTPAQLQSFCLAQPQQPALRICFDLDHTLVTAPRRAGDYSSCEPIEENIGVCRELHAQGHTIIIATGRRMRTHGGNVPAVVADIGEVTMRQLRDFGIPHHEISFGKPYAQFYIDDLAVHAHRDLHKELGFYAGSPACKASQAAPPKPPPPPCERWAATAAPPSPRWLSLLLAASAGVGAGLLLGLRLRAN